MRCIACNSILSNKEATRKYASTGNFIDLCDHCFDTVEDQIPSIDGRDTNDEEGASQEGETNGTGGPYAGSVQPL